MTISVGWAGSTSKLLECDPVDHHLGGPALKRYFQKRQSMGLRGSWLWVFVYFLSSRRGSRQPSDEKPHALGSSVLG